ncbi:MAG TPA: sulfotransferase domain-containing protein [Candidatus Acidoferrum sp.]|nr:sulfotransferase domain-containing protein [Candidatus Acidoferrum sp.]
MIHGIKTVVKYFLGTDRAERDFAVYPDDTFVVSYPRSGNTWTRFLIANLVYPEKNVGFTNIEKLIPDTSSQSNRALKSTPRPRIIKSHEYFDHRYRKVIYIVRDPRDVALSYYDFQRKYMQIDDAYPLEQYVEDFVQGRLISIDWGTWAENVSSWIYTRGKSTNFLLLRYEDMMKDTTRELTRMAQFFGIEMAPTRLQEVINRSSADRMRELEKLEADRWIATKNRRKDIPFVRVAKAGGWRTSLPVKSVEQIENAWGDLMITLGYEPVTVQVPQGVR